MNATAPVFIVGSPRSGTTWLYHILLSSGGFAIYRTEPKVFTYLAPRFGGFRSREQRERFLKRWLETEDFRRSGLDPGPFRVRILDECRSAGDFLGILMGSIAREQQARRWCDSTPDNLLVMEEIHRAFPDALFIHVVRDGRDVALSLSRQQWIRPLPGDRDAPAYLPAGLYWSWAVGRGRAAGRRLGGAYLEVLYEDLVRTPETALGRISAFLGHFIDYAKVRRTAIGSVSRPNTSFDAPAPRDFQPMGRWRSLLSESELRRLESLIGPRLLECGYQPATCPLAAPSPADRLRRLAYSVNFSFRLELKRKTPLPRLLQKQELLDAPLPEDDTDPTLRPGAHRELIRQLVSGG